jgi:hypothetical protein
MLKKLTGIFILLSFLLVKSTPLFAIDKYKQSITISCTEEPSADDTSDSEKENKQLETIDEDFIQACIALPGFLMLSNQTTLFNVGRINTPYISLPYPPPNGRLA